MDLVVPFPAAPGRAGAAPPEHAAAASAAAPTGSLAWDLAPGTPARATLDGLPVLDLHQHIFRAGRKIKEHFVPAFTRAMVGVLLGLRASVRAAAAARVAAAAAHVLTADAWAKLFHILPALLLSADGARSRAVRFGMLDAGDLAPVVDGELRFSRANALKVRGAPSLKEVRRAAVAAARLAVPGGLRRAVRALEGGTEAFTASTPVTLAHLESKHPAGDAPPASRRRRWRRGRWRPCVPRSWVWGRRRSPLPTCARAFDASTPRPALGRPPSATCSSSNASLRGGPC